MLVGKVPGHVAVQLGLHEHGQGDGRGRERRRDHGQDAGRPRSADLAHAVLLDPLVRRQHLGLQERGFRGLDRVHGVVGAD